LASHFLAAYFFLSLIANSNTVESGNEGGFPLYFTTH